MKVKEVLETMDYGKAPEDSKPALEWIEKKGAKFGLFINGESKLPEGREFFESLNPATGEVLATICQAKQEDVDRAMKGVSAVVEDWSGGTRIGAALKNFNYHWARRVLGRGAVVLLISDGWDRGDPALLSREIARLQRSCHRLIWLNPLLGSPDYEPLTRGMQAALPHVDDFLPVHNLSSLEQLAHHLSRLDRRRPVRRQFLAAGRSRPMTLKRAW